MARRRGQMVRGLGEHGGRAGRSVRWGAAATLAALVAALGLFGPAVPASLAFAELASQTAVQAGEASSASTSTFNDPYTAWSGYATTAAESGVAGAVPVSAPASAQTAWSAEATSCTVRQQGQSTFVYSVSASSVTKCDASSGSVLAQAELDGSAIGTCSFVDGVLVVPLADGRLAAYDEDLACAWVSDDGVAPTTAGASDAWTACSPVASGGGCAFVGFCAFSEGSVEATLAVFSLVDGSLLWQSQLCAEGEAAEAASVPAVEYADTADGSGLLLATDGGNGVYLLDAATGDILDAQTAAAEGCAAAAVPLSDSAPGLEGAMLVAASDGTVRLWGIDNDSALKTGAAASMGGDVSGCTPVVCNGSVLLGSAAGTIYELELPASFDEEMQLAGTVDTGLAQGVAALLPVAYGADARSMTLVLYAQGFDGTLLELTCERVDIQTASVQQLAGASVAASSMDGDSARTAACLCAPVVNRDGTLLVCAGGKLTAYAADSDLAVTTPVGGSTGLDTLGTTMAGLSLPNGAGIGVGVLVFAAAFGGYAYIRNGGGKRSRDEGLDAWRERHNAARGDGDGFRGRGGRR